MSGDREAATATRSRAIFGTLWTISGSIAQQLFSLLIFVLLARLLEPREFGVVAFASVFIDMLNVFGRAGLTDVVVQRQSMNEEELSTAFWSSGLLGLAATVALYGLAPLAAAMLDLPEIEKVLELLSISVLIYTLGTVPEALMRRDFEFKSLAIRNFIATVISGVAAALMAFLGYGVMSLVAQRVIFAVINTALLWGLSSFRPSFAFSAAECLRQIKLGLSLCVSVALSMGNQRVVDFLVGYLLGPQALGILRIGSRCFELLLELVVRPVSQIAQSAFARFQGDRRLLGDSYVRIAQLTAIVVYPMFFGFALVAPDVVPMIFGEKWRAAIGVAQIISLSALTLPHIFFKTNLLMGIGRPGALLVLNLVEFAISTVIVLVMARFGLEAAAWGNVMRGLIITAPIVLALRAQAAVDVRKLFAMSAAPALAALAMVLALLALETLLPDGVNLYLSLAAIILSGALVYGLTLLLAGRDQIIGLVHFVLGGPAATAARLRRIPLARRVLRFAVPQAPNDTITGHGPL